jgi:hypothetical protein
MHVAFIIRISQPKQWIPFLGHLALKMTSYAYGLEDPGIVVRLSARQALEPNY